jgi:hypothetical protein
LLKEAEMQEAYWNGLFDTRWEDAPLGREAIRLVLWLRERGHGERSRREYAHAVVHLGRVLHEAQGEVTARALDEMFVEEFIRGHLPICSCYRQRPGRRAEHTRRGLAHLLAMLREEGTIPPAAAVPNRLGTSPGAAGKTSSSGSKTCERRKHM